MSEFRGVRPEDITHDGPLAQAFLGWMWKIALVVVLVNACYLISVPFIWWHALLMFAFTVILGSFFTFLIPIMIKQEVYDAELRLLRNKELRKKLKNDLDFACTLYSNEGLENERREYIFGEIERIIKSINNIDGIPDDESEFYIIRHSIKKVKWDGVEVPDGVIAISLLDKKFHVFELYTGDDEESLIKRNDIQFLTPDIDAFEGDEEIVVSPFYYKIISKERGDEPDVISSSTAV